MLQWFNNPMKGTHSSIDDHMETDFSVVEIIFRISTRPFNIWGLLKYVI